MSEIKTASKTEIAKQLSKARYACERESDDIAAAICGVAP